jgi:hypothetical protein
MVSSCEALGFFHTTQGILSPVTCLTKLFFEHRLHTYSLLDTLQREIVPC